MTPEWDFISFFIVLPFMIIASLIISAFAFCYAFDRRGAWGACANTRQKAKALRVLRFLLIASSSWDARRGF